jgi:hypothetical protein
VSGNDAAGEHPSDDVEPERAGRRLTGGATRWEPTDDDLAAVLAWSREQGLVWAPKHTSPLMHVVGAVLGALRVLPRRTFMERYTTIVRHRAWAPWVGRPTRTAEERWARIQTVVHELQHWIQWQRNLPGVFAVGYVVSQHHRARWEAEAYGCNVELAAWRGDSAPDVDAIADQLREYGCGDAARDEARRLLAATQARAMGGTYGTEAVLRALPLLAERRRATQPSASSGAQK